MVSTRAGRWPPRGADGPAACGGKLFVLPQSVMANPLITHHGCGDPALVRSLVCSSPEVAVVEFTEGDEWQI